jgi:hypothetical protein
LKFAQLPIGTRFTFRGRTFRKLSPIEAADAADETHKLIPRSAKVVMIDGNSRPVTAELPAQLPRDAVETALAACATRLRDKARSLYPPLNASQLASLDNLLQTVQSDFTTRLGLDNPQETSAADNHRDAAATPPNKEL